MPLYPPQIQTVMDPWSTHDCRLDWVSTTVVRLSRYKGMYLMINGVRCVIPVAGIDLNISGYGNGSFIIYAWSSGSTVAGIGGALAPLPLNNDSFGMPCVNNNPTLTLIGLVGVSGGTMPHHGWVCSYWNRKQRSVFSSFVIQATGSTVLVELNSNMRCVFTSFAGEGFEAWASGTGYNNDVLGLILVLQLYLDAVALGSSSYVQPHYASWYNPIGQRIVANTPTDATRTLVTMGAINAAGYTGQFQLQTGVRWLG